MKKVIFAVIAVLAVAGGAGAYWYGNRPKVTYYPGGQIKTSVEQKFFKEDGEYKAFNEDGTLSQKYTVIDGMKVGQGFVYAGGVTVEVNFAGGKLSGPIKLDTKGKVPDLDNLQISAAGNELTVKLPENKSDDKQNDVDLTDPDVSFKAKIVCDETEFLNAMQAFLSVQNLNSFKAFGKCLSLTESLIEDDIYKCEFKGGYQYPKFTAESKFECGAKGDSEQFLAAMFASYGITDAGKISAVMNYNPSEKKFSFNIVDDKGVINQVQTFKGLEEIITAVVEFTFSKQDAQDTAKMASEILKNFVISDSHTAINGKVVSAVKGEFNFINGFSNPWTASFFGVENTMTSQMKINDKGLLMNIAYPISKKPLLSIGMQIDESFKDKYKSIIETVLKEFSENPEDVATEHLMAKLPEYSMTFSNVIKSVNALLMSNKGEKVLGAVLSIKKGADLMSAAENPTDAFTAKIISYRNNKPYKVISGDPNNGFVVDGKVVPVEEVSEYLNKDALEAVSKQVETEYNEVYKIMQENNYPSDPFIRGFYEGYYSTIQKYKSSEVIGQIVMIANNIRAAYADSENFGNLDNAMALDLKVIPDEMITPDGNIVDALGGKIDIYSSPAFEGDDEKLSFILKVGGISQVACRVIATTDWEADSGIMGMGVNQNLDDLYLDESENEKAEQCAAEGILCAIEHNMHMIEAAQVCKPDDNVLYFKFQ